jgi:hypothetical protein
MKRPETFDIKKVIPINLSTDVDVSTDVTNISEIHNNSEESHIKFQN